MTMENVPDDTQEKDIEFDTENHFKHNVFYTLLDCVIGNLTRQPKS